MFTHPFLDWLDSLSALATIGLAVVIYYGFQFLFMLYDLVKYTIQTWRDD